MSVRSVLLLLEAARTWLYSNYTLTRAVGENGVTPETRLEDSLEERMKGRTGLYSLTLET